MRKAYALFLYYKVKNHTYMVIQTVMLKIICFDIFNGMESKMNVGIYISGKSGRLTNFLLQENNDYIEQIKIVVSDTYIEEKLKEILVTKKINFSEYYYERLNGSNRDERNIHLSDCIKKELDNYKIDYCFSFGSHILKGELLSAYKNKIINFHPSILPMYPGLYAIDQAVRENKSFLIGNTAHFIDEGVDTGPIIMQTVLPIQAFFEANGEYDLVLDLQIEMMKKLIKLLNEKKIVEKDGKIVILGANYNTPVFFPVV